MRQAVPIILGAGDRRQFQRHIRSRRSAVRLVERSKIVLLAAAGNTNKEISLVLGIDPHKVGRWRHRYAARGYHGIVKDAPRGANHGGKKTDDQTRRGQKILRRTTQDNPNGATHWSTRSMAQAVGCQHSFVHRVWKAHGLKPHLVKHFKVSNDPRFEEKLHDVVGLYLNPPE
ncbi:MAG: helix-turn-helix domain-containing protein, partial [Candidatus Tectomicrobia bacterium]